MDVKVLGNIISFIALLILIAGWILDMRRKSIKPYWMKIAPVSALIILILYFIIYLIFK